MSWIKTISYEKATTKLKRIYERIKGPNNYIDNVLMIHSLRPHSLVGHMALYKNVLHHSNNQLPKWYLEAIGVYVSHLNQCDYCVAHHFVGLKRLLKDNKKAEAFLDAVKRDALNGFFDEKYFKGAAYAKQLTLQLSHVQEQDIENLRQLGFSDGEILEINQVASYFNYVNRTVVGLGVNNKGETLGLSPNDSNDPNNWSHY